MLQPKNARWVYDPQPAYTADILEVKKIRRKADRKYQETGLVVHLQIYRDKWCGLARLIDGAKKQYFTERLVEAQSDPKGVFKVIDRLMDRSTQSIFPSHDTPVEMVDKFVEFFTHNITKICNDLSHMRDYQQNLHEQASPDEDAPPVCRNSSLPQKLRSGNWSYSLLQSHVRL